MKKIALYLFMGVVALLYGCNKSDSILSPVQEGTDSEFDIKAENSTVTYYDADGKKATDQTAFAFTDSKKTVNVKLILSSTTSNKIKRLYITRNVYGTGAKPYQFEDTELSKAGLRSVLKADGSVDIDEEGKDVDITVTLPTLKTGEGAGVTGGEIIYQIWGTGGALSSKGDFRDTEKRKVTALVTIKLKKGTPPAEKPLKTFTAKLLYPPTKDGTSKSFMSTFDGTVYAFNDSELAALWDVGYYYGGTGEASLASPKEYPSSVSDINTITGLEDKDLNAFYMELGSSSDYDSANTASLGSLSVGTKQKLNNLNKDDIIKFKDAYGKKGVIKVAEIKAGNGSDDYIKLDFKMQP